ncbi:MAG: RIP metalloprotease RseP [Gammaproteobacteria bacterium]|nr:RIP metalloprotease RseP [Gammaproteobacteria bacterium]MBK80139.1 RIP metalloprotease RseP [Gammaproteobacteria bacterium]
MEILQYPLALLVTLGVLVTFHELGHYLVARWSGVRIVRFSVGFGRPIWSRMDRRGTEWAVAAIPLGGYVRMLDEREPGTVEAEARPGDVSYNDLSVGWRAAIAAAGPLANFVLAIVVYWFLFVAGNTTIAPMLGTVPEGSPADRAGLEPGLEIVSVDGESARSWQQVTMALAGRLGDSGSIELGVRRPGAESIRQVGLAIDDWHRGVDEPDLLASLGIEPALPPVLGEILPDSPAERAGLRRFDRVVAVDGEPQQRWSDWVDTVQAAPDRALTVTVDRDGRRLDLSVRPEARDAGGEAAGYVGVAPYLNEIRYGPLAAIPMGVAETWDKTALTLGLLKKMVTGDVSMKNLSGPITIARVAGDSARSGWTYFLGVLALLSISLGVLNLLPIPILDGGHLLFCAAEAATGRPVSERIQLLGTQIGLFLVAGLMVLALYNDISRLF